MSAYYLYRGIRFRFFMEDSLETKVPWYFLHLGTAIAPLMLGPLQFWTRLRIRHPALHRTLGKVYLAGSALGALTALYLGVTIDLEGSVVHLVLLSSIWLFMVAGAWITIRRGNRPGIGCLVFGVTPWPWCLCF